MLGLLTIIVLVAVWEGVVRSGLLSYQYLPAPSAITQGGHALFSSGELLANLAHTLQVTLLGWLAASSIGLSLGVLLGLSSSVWRYAMASIEVMRAVPPVSLVPVALLIFGFSLQMELTVIGYASMWPVVINTIHGVRGVRAELLDVARILRLPPLARLRKIVLPAAMPSIVVGMRLALSLSLVLAVVTEMIGIPSGLCNAVIIASQALQPAQMFAYVVTIGLLGIALNTGFRYITSRALPGFAAAPAEASR